MKIAVYAIAKNEQQNVADWYENVKDADGIFVLDTGSKDETRPLLESLGVNVTRMPTGQTFRFDHARNQAAHLVPQDFDVLVSLDFDERFAPGWRQVIEENFTEEMDAANYTLVYGHDEQGNITMSYPRLAIHRPGIATWQYPIHEILVPTQQGQRPTFPLLCVHYGQQKEPGHYLELLKLAHAEHPDDARCIQYLAREYYAMGNFAMAKPLYEQHIDVEPFGPFRSESCRRMAHMADDSAVAEWWYRHAIQHCEEIRENYCYLASFYFQQKKYEHAVSAIRSALQYERPDYDMIFEDVYYNGPWCYHMLMACYQQLGYHRAAAAERDRLLFMFQGNPPADIARDIAILNKSIQEAFHVYLDSMGL